MCSDFIEAGEQLQTELAMEPRVFSVETAYPKGEHRILGLWVRPDEYFEGTCSPVTPDCTSGGKKNETEKKKGDNTDIHAIRLEL